MNHATFSAQARTALRLAALAATLTLSLGTGQAAPAGIGAGTVGAAANTGGHVLEVGTTVPGFPHKVDVYRPAGATRAIVYLHGNNGTTGALAYTLGFSRGAVPSARTVNWEWLSQNGVVAVLPQGQAAPGSTMRTWSNYIFKSGQDDVAFLAALATQVRSRYGVADVSLAGYSSGGMMSARMWCEATGAYRSYVSVAGPMMSGSGLGLTCTPALPAPYAVLLGARDPVLPAYNPGLPPPTPEQASAGLTSGFLVAEWTRHGDRSRWTCGESPPQTGADAGTGPAWAQCDDRMHYTVVTQADHTLSSFQNAMGAKIVDTILGLLR